MKRFLPFLLLLSLTLPSHAQRNNYTLLWNEDPRTHRFVFNGNGYLPDASQEELYSRAKEFLTKTLNGERDTVMANDSDKAIVCKGAFLVSAEKLGDRGNGYVTCTFSIKCSKRFYKYSLTNFEHFALNPDGFTGGHLENERPDSGGWDFPVHYWNQVKAQAYHQLVTFVSQFKEAMAHTNASQPSNTF